MNRPGDALMNSSAPVMQQNTITSVGATSCQFEEQPIKTWSFISCIYATLLSSTFTVLLLLVNTGTSLHGCTNVYFYLKPHLALYSECTCTWTSCLRQEHVHGSCLHISLWRLNQAWLTLHQDWENKWNSWRAVVVMNAPSFPLLLSP